MQFRPEPSRDEAMLDSWANGLKMLQTMFAAALLLGSTLVAAQAQDPVTTELFHPNRYIVEFSDAGSARFRKRDGSRDTEEFMRILQDGGADVEPVFSFTSNLFHGASFNVNNATGDDITAIQSLPEVANVWPAAYFTLGAEPQELLENSSSLASWDPHSQTNVSQVHSLGNLGEGVVVAVVDSGIDYTHPALGGGFGPGFKVDGGWDFTSNSPDPKDCLGHGTHVAGIIASDDQFIKGVAPKATLRAYKVFTCADGTTEDMAIAAFLRAHEEGADVINGSLGGDRPFPDSPIALVLSRIQAEGTLIVVAAGPFFTTNLGNNFGGLTVGSIEHDTLIAHPVTAHSSSGESRTFVYVSSESQPFNLTGNVSASWRPEGTREYLACFIAQPAPTIPNENLIVLPRSSVCGWQSHDNKLNNKVDWVFWYNLPGAEWEVPTRIMYDRAVQPVGSALISYEDGDWLVSQHEAGNEITYVFNLTSGPVVAERPSWAGGRLNSFSSWGPTIDARTKPEVVTPGGSIYSTYPGGGWVSFSGTSMASPYAAGLSALVLKAHGTRATRDDAAAFARRRIIAGAQPIKHPDGSGVPASIGQQGAGLVNAVKAVLHSTAVNPSYINLNDTDNFQSTHQIEITNSGDEQVVYQLTHRTEPTYFSRNAVAGTIENSPAHSTDSADIAVVQLSTTEVTIGPGQTVSVDVTFAEPEASDANRLPVYGGGIDVSGSNGERLSVSYMGIKGSLKNIPHWGGDSRPFLNPDGQAMTEGGTYSFNDSNVPYGTFMMVWSTRQFSFDFVGRDWTPSNWTWPLVPGENNFYGSFRTTGNGNDFVDANFPVNSFPRLARQFFARPTGTFSNGDELADGEYRYLRRSVETFGDPNNINDWQWDLSPPFTVKRAV